MFKVGATYTRKEINNAVGGGVQSYLPTRDGKVVAACLTREYNYLAPKVVLVGRGKVIEQTAEMLSKQSSAVPVFMKKESNSWRYIGMYKGVQYLTDAGVVSSYASCSGRDDVIGVLRLEPVEDAVGDSKS